MQNKYPFTKTWIHSLSSAHVGSIHSQNCSSCSRCGIRLRRGMEGMFWAIQITSPQIWLSPAIPCLLGGTPASKHCEIKISGITIDSHLSFNTHIQSGALRANARLHLHASHRSSSQPHTHRDHAQRIRQSPPQVRSPRLGGPLCDHLYFLTVFTALYKNVSTEFKTQGDQPQKVHIGIHLSTPIYKKEYESMYMYQTYWTLFVVARPNYAGPKIEYCAIGIYLQRKRSGFSLAHNLCLQLFLS